MVTIETKSAGISAVALARFVQRARQAARLSGRVHVLVVSSRRMRSLNRRFRGHDRVTDVLSFPAVPAVARDFAGDIVISADIAAANARRLHHSLAEELKVLVLHGILHLVGHDHETDDGEMAREEDSLREKFRLSDSLIRRSAESGVSSLKKKRHARNSKPGARRPSRRTR